MNRLFHLSDDFEINEFRPRPVRKEVWGDLKDSVWTVNQEKLQNFMLPRNCPRVCWRLNAETSGEDKEYFESFGDQQSLIFVQKEYIDMVNHGKLMMYEFNNDNFYLVDDCAGYYVSHEVEVPTQRIMITDLNEWLDNLNAKLIYVDDLREYASESVRRTYDFSNIRMGMLK